MSRYSFQRGRVTETPDADPIARHRGSETRLASRGLRARRVEVKREETELTAAEPSPLGFHPFTSADALSM
ncbi:hypothetical protein EYF80_042422 [Liparis tanakae]|uniref:Uncharacterized protein n=1 Tax=Liparis tanakae TaxID=230148 RepID=A0A4Z2G2J8_9TELE|nr:hypothetical protein EYF80_042422 [Liparis tanakae]